MCNFLLRDASKKWQRRLTAWLCSDIIKYNPVAFSFYIAGSHIDSKSGSEEDKVQWDTTITATIIIVRSRRRENKTISASSLRGSVLHTDRLRNIIIIPICFVTVMSCCHSRYDRYHIFCRHIHLRLLTFLQKTCKNYDTNHAVTLKRDWNTSFSAGRPQFLDKWKQVCF